jgi:PAS domain S-box-containing protein
LKSPILYNQFYQLYETQLRRSAQYGVVITDVNQRIAEVNQLILSKCGYKAEEVRRTPLSQLFPAVGKNLSDQKDLWQLATKQGSRENYKADITPIVDERTGVIGHMIKLSEPVVEAEKIIAEETSSNLTVTSVDAVSMNGLLKKQTFLNKLIENRNELVWSIDRDYKYSYFNKHFAKTIKQTYNVDPVTGDSVFNNIPDDMSDFWKPFYTRSLNGETHFFARPFINNGTETFFEFYFEPLRDDDEIIAGVSIFGRDITFQHNLKQHLQKARDDAERANIAKTEFLANISHELRTPLNGVIGFTNLVLDTPLTDKQLEYLNIVRRSSESLLRMINDLLDISKIESGKMELLEEEFNLQELFQDIIHPLLIKAHQRNNEILLTYDANLPVRTISDKGKLQQIMINLIGNAVKFSENSIVNVRVQNKTEENGAIKMYVEVQDHGIGVQPEVIEKIFEPFTQADSSFSRKYGGTGLGLSISKRLLQLMHSDLSVKSTFGLGSTFYFTVPIKVPEHLEIKNEIIQSVIIDKADNDMKKKYRILLAEDNEINQLLTERLLHVQGYETTIVSNGLLALEKFESEEFDLLLIDIQMPEMDGMELITRIREKEKLTNTHVPVLVLTAHVMPDDLNGFLQSGADGYVTKPVMMDQLRNAIQKALKVQA